MNFSKKHKKHLSDVYDFYCSHYRCIDVCGAYDSDAGCTMPRSDMYYACPFESLHPDNVEDFYHYVCHTFKKRNRGDN